MTVLSTLPDAWKDLLADYLCHAEHALECAAKRQKNGAVIVPRPSQIFRAFQLVNPMNVKVVIVGQDPYPNIESATGLAFGVNRGIDCPRTLTNIINEIESDINEPEWDHKTKLQIPKDTILLNRSNMTLEGWAKQGVLLLNSCLTTEDGRIGAHANIGWETFTDYVLYTLKELHTVGKVKPLVLMLWGAVAQEKYAKIVLHNAVPNWMKVLKSTHPSPLSFNRGDLLMQFQGSKHFTQANFFLRKHGATAIDWSKTGE